MAIEYRWAEHHQDRLPQLAAELVQVIVAGGCPPSALAAKTATSTIPIVFEVAIDPIKAGLVASPNRPSGNITGVVNLNVEVAPKWLELIRELTPTAATIAVLLNPTSEGPSRTVLPRARSGRPPPRNAAPYAACEQRTRL